MEYDLVIKGGTIVDGLQRPRYRADVGVIGGRIATIGSIKAAHGARVLDASGMIVAPGFIDCHTHYDAQIQWDPWCTISGWHGVTSVLVGNCGFGFAPCPPELRERFMLMMERNEAIAAVAMQKGMLWDWETFPEWMDSLDRMPKGVNVASYVPVNPVMVAAMSLEGAKSGRTATPDEQAEMKRLVHEGMDVGALGWSAQRLGEQSLQSDFDGTPMPSDTMTDEDCFALAAVIAERGGVGIIQLTQLKDLGDATGESDLAFQRELTRRTGGGSLFHNSVVPMGGPGAAVHKRRLEWLDECRAEGLDVYGQAISARYRTEWKMDLFNLFDFSPVWQEATLGSLEEKLQKMADPARRPALREHYGMINPFSEAQADVTDAETLSPVGGPLEVCVVLDDGGNPELSSYVGRTLGAIGEDEGKHAVDVMLDLSVKSGLQMTFQGAGCQISTRPEVVSEVVRHPAVVPGQSDGGAHTKFFAGGSYTTDYLTWMVRDTEQVTLEEAHFKLGYLSGQFAGIRDRGFLLEGAPADIVVYDFENLSRVPEWSYEILHDQPAGEWRRAQRATGYRYTIVNGEVTFEDGVCTDFTPGRLLRHGKASEG